MSSSRGGWLVASLLVALSAAFVPADARACMPGVWHPQQDAVILWNDGVEVLVWRALVEQTPPPGARPATPPRPAQHDVPFAWLLAVPSAPIAYEVVDVADFQGTLDWSRSYESMRPGAPGGQGRGGIGGIDVGTTELVGEYEVTPIQGTGPDAGRGLATWLRRHHFPAAHAGAVDKYASEGATFLAVRATLPAGKSRAALRPLAIAFRSDRVVVPVRLSAGEQPFALSGVIFSSRAPSADRALGHGLDVVPVRQAGRIARDGEDGQAAIIAHVSVAAVMRRIIARIAPRVPQLRRLEHGSLAFVMFRARPLRVAIDAPDPSFALGAIVPEAAASAVLSGAALTARELPAAPPSDSPSPASAQTPQPAPASPAAATSAGTTTSNEGGGAAGCSIRSMTEGGAGGATALGSLSLLLLALVTRRGYLVHRR